MNNWGGGWRKMVKWDNHNKLYMYKGRKVYPLSYKEQIEMPVHLQNSYYWGEIAHIDKIAKQEEKTPAKNGQQELQEALNMFYELFGI